MNKWSLSWLLRIADSHKLKVSFVELPKKKKGLKELISRWWKHEEEN